MSTKPSWCEPGAWEYVAEEVNREEVEVGRRVRFLFDNSQYNNLRSVVRGSGIRVGLMANFSFTAQGARIYIAKTVVR